VSTAKVHELIDRLRNNFGTPKEERFLTLIGASGSGKFSLASADSIPPTQRGVLPASAKRPLVRWRPAVAAALQVSRPALSSLLNSKADMSGNMALHLEKAFGVKMDTLMRMQSAYDIAKTRKR